MNYPPPTCVPLAANALVVLMQAGKLPVTANPCGMDQAAFDASSTKSDTELEWEDWADRELMVPSGSVRGGGVPMWTSCNWDS